MNEDVRKHLCQLINKYGQSLTGDSRRCDALLKDHCGQYKREIFALINALKIGVAEDLINEPSSTPVIILIQRLSKRLEDELGLAENIAKWTVETWAIALRLERQAEQILPAYANKENEPHRAKNDLEIDELKIDKKPIASQNSPFIILFTKSPAGKLHFPKFSVGEIFIGEQKIKAIGDIEIPSGQIVELKIFDDITDFSFLKTFDPSNLVKKLNLSDNRKLTQGSLLNFSKLKNIEYLSLNNCTDLGWLKPEDNAVIGSFKKLLELDLGNNDGGKFALEHVSTTLESLTLYMPRSSDFIEIPGISDFPHIARLILLKKLDLTGSAIDDANLRYLKYLKNLKELSLKNCANITGAGILTHIGGMSHLKILNLNECRNINQSRLQELRAILPNTNILT